MDIQIRSLFQEYALGNTISVQVQEVFVRVTDVSLMVFYLWRGQDDSKQGISQEISEIFRKELFQSERWVCFRWSKVFGQQDVVGNVIFLQDVLDQVHEVLIGNFLQFAFALDDLLRSQVFPKFPAATLHHIFCDVFHVIPTWRGSLTIPFRLFLSFSRALFFIHFLAGTIDGFIKGANLRFLIKVFIQFLIQVLRGRRLMAGHTIFRYIKEVPP